MSTRATLSIFAVGLLVTVALGESGPVDDQFEASVAIMVDGRALELTDPTDQVASPALGDWDGNGRRDLLVGQHSGRMRVFRNLGTDDRPEFSDPVWFDEIVADGRTPVG